MQTIEAKITNDSAVSTCPATDTEIPKDNYEAVRYNAMKHGILSRLAVLAWPLHYTPDKDVTLKKLSY